MKMEEKIKNIIKESIEVKKELLKSHCGIISQIAQSVITCLNNKGKIILLGNGGSAADCQHMAAELVGRFQRERKALPAISLTTDTSILTSLGNDYGFENIFSRQIEALADKKDLVIAISTSGNSKNVILAAQMAKRMKLKTIAFTGGRGGKLAKIADILLIVPSRKTARIQEAHGLCLHAICEIVEQKLSKK